MQTQKPMQRLARRIRTLVGCVALCGLAVVSITAALPGGVASSASAYADDSIPAQTAKAVERHVIVSDGNFETLRDAIGQALPSVTTVVELSGDYEAPTSFDKSYITIPDKADVRISVPDGSNASLRRAEGSVSTYTLFSLKDNESSLAISGDFTYHDSFTMAYVGKGCSLTINGGTFSNNSATGNGGLIYANGGTLTINGGMQAIGYGLLVLFFAIGIFRSASGFRDFQRPEHLLRHFIYFVLAKLGITYGMDLLVDVFDVCSGIVATAAGSVGGLTGASVALPQEIADAIGDVGFLASIPLWLVTLLGSLMITVLAFIMILTVYGRFFKIYMYAALSPVALASFAGEGTSHFGKAFLRSYVGVCMEGAVIVLACIIFSAFSSSGTPVVDSSASVVTQVWSYLGEVIFNLLVLVGLVKSADHIVKEMLGL